MQTNINTWQSSYLSKLFHSLLCPCFSGAQSYRSSVKRNGRGNGNLICTTRRSTVGAWWVLWNLYLHVWLKCTRYGAHKWNIIFHWFSDLRVWDAAGNVSCMSMIDTQGARCRCMCDYLFFSFCTSISSTAWWICHVACEFVCHRR